MHVLNDTFRTLFIHLFTVFVASEKQVVILFCRVFNFAFFLVCVIVFYIWFALICYYKLVISSEYWYLYCFLFFSIVQPIFVQF
jgi:hypothetical protein